MTIFEFKPEDQDHHHGDEHHHDDHHGDEHHHDDHHGDDHHGDDHHGDHHHSACAHPEYELLNIFNWKGIGPKGGTVHTYVEEQPWMPAFWKCSGPGSDPMGEISMTMAFNTFIVSGILIALFKKGTRKIEFLPGKAQAFAEIWVDGLRNFFASFGGEYVATKYFGLLGAYFTFILSLNLWGIIPGFHSPTANINTTLAFGVVGVIASLVIGLKESGLKHIIDHWMGEPEPGDGLAKVIGAVLLLPLEIVAQFARMISLALRLFGNIYGGDVVLAVFVVLLADIAVKIWIPLPLQLPVLLLHILASVIQAIVFTALISVYISGFCSHHHDEEHDHKH